MALSNFPSGPLDRYRTKASFDWKKLRIFLDGEELVEYENELFAEIRQHPVFCGNNSKSPSLDETRQIATRRMFTLSTMKSASFTTFSSLRAPSVLFKILNSLDPATSIKYGLSFGMFPSVVRSLGSSRHLHYVLDAMDGNLIGCYCLTEIGHGSNAQSMRTTATYDTNTKQFVLHSPDFEAAKCWAGNLGQTATHAVVYAQLITPDGISHGLHPFVVKIRDTKTLLPYPGITVGDMGEKLGLNGIDNGFLMFNQYRIPRIDLLNKTGDVSEEGKYVTPYRDPGKRYGASLGALSNGRVSITNICATYGIKAITIAIRYAAVRKQFGPQGGKEIPIIEYQSHQCRLIPHLAAVYALKIFAIYLMEVQYQFTIDTFADSDNSSLADLGLELHAVSSACKPVAGWTVRDAVQECREACAGHGYLKASGIGDIRNNHDANLTYEGENHVLIQQTSNWLLKMAPTVTKGGQVSSPLGSIDFLSNWREILTRTFTATSVEATCALETILDAYQWLVCYLLKTSTEKQENLVKEGVDAFSAKNESQVFYCKNLAIAYIQHFILQRMHAKITEATELQIRNVLSKLFSLYGITALEKHIATFYQGGYMVSSRPVTLVQNSILQLCREIKDDAVALVDAVAPPDFLLQSVLGNSDGQVYKHLEGAMLGNPDALIRPKWWREVVQWKDHIKAKL